MKGYLKNKTANKTLRGGFHSGDLAVMHPWILQLKDRLKDIIISGREYFFY